MTTLVTVVLDPDSQVRETITYFFETFLRVGSASQTVKVFKKEGLLFPSCMRNSKFLVFQHLTASTALRMLNNPRYAGAYAYGRRHYRKLADGRKVPRKRDRNDWLACIPDAYPGYITWEQFQQNLAVLEMNGVAGTKLRDRRHLERKRLYCRDAPSADAVVGTFDSGTLRGGGDRKSGMSAIEHMGLVENLAASQLRERRLMRQLAH
ncbi:Mobile element protein [Candidatus Burkholderia pumila]|uniref:Mobile element protein n=1 Tax=Candidatus Burkholderia pumila TaxID=1090375 RepID=A0ABR5HK51_9BURK|nr:Mobile element protein [Candidatus Burkholderia pumila]